MREVTNSLGVRQVGRDLGGGSLLGGMPNFKEAMQKFSSIDQEPSTAAGTVGDDSSQPQNGSSSAPDEADQVRIVGKPAMGARQQEFANRPGNFGGKEPDTADLVSPMYADSNRAAERAEILDAPTLTPMGLRAIKDKYLAMAKSEASSSDAQVMGAPKEEADAIASGGSVETVIDGDNVTTTIKDATPPASRTQQPDFNGEAPEGTSDSQTAEDGERANTNPSEVDKAQAFLKEKVGRIKFPKERKNLAGTEENPGNEDISDAPTLPSPVDGNPVLDLRSYYEGVENTGNQPLDLDAIRKNSVPAI